MLLLNLIEIRKKKTSLINDQIDVIACVKKNIDIKLKMKICFFSFENFIMNPKFKTFKNEIFKILRIFIIFKTSLGETIIQRCEKNVYSFLESTSNLFQTQKIYIIDDDTSIPCSLNQIKK